MASDDYAHELLTAAHEAARRIPHGTHAVTLYRRASAAAADIVPGPLGLAIAGVLEIAALNRELTGLAGVLGEHNAMLSLALAVLGE